MWRVVCSIVAIREHVVRHWYVVVEHLREKSDQLAEVVRDAILTGGDRGLDDSEFVSYGKEKLRD